MSRTTRGGRNAIIATVIGALALAMGVSGLSPAAATQPDMICDEAGYETKVDTTGDPATVSYTAPAGYLVDAYCVKASTEKVIVPVTPPSATVTIDHPNVDSVSHYQVRLVPIPKLTASASVSTLPPTCELGEQLIYGAITNATFSGTANGTYGPGSYAVTATAAVNAEFSPGVTTDTFNGELAGPLDESDPACVTEEEPTLVPPPVWAPVPTCLDGIQVYPIGEPVGDYLYETDYALSSYVATDTTVTVTHAPKLGVQFFEPGRDDAYTLNEDGTATMVFDFSSFYEECETPVDPPVEEPPAEEEPATEEPVKESPVTEQPTKVSTVKHEALAATGFDGTLAMLAFGLIVGGATLVMRRRRASVQ